MVRHLRIALGVVAFGVVGRVSWAATPPATSLDNCQHAVRAATKTFITKQTAAIGTCLQAVSTQLVQNHQPDASGAAHVCVNAFRTLDDSRGLGNQLSDKLAAAITKKCAPGQPGVTHTLADITGSGAGVAQPLNAENLNAWCGYYGGSGSVATLEEWIGCITAAAQCSVTAAIAAQYPRGLDWLDLAKAAMTGVTPPPTDPTQVADAIAGLTAIADELDPNGIHTVGVGCGGPLRLLQTGQTTAYGPESDGALQKGAARSYTDNGDGTITDNNTGLMWEKKDMAGGIHDVGNVYTWSATLPNLNGTIVTDFLATLNAGSGFAGHTDWRLPNLYEIQSIANNGNGPSVFDTPCGSGCTVTSCSCSSTNFLWQSTTFGFGNPNAACLVKTSDATALQTGKGAALAARAVRGGR